MKHIDLSFSSIVNGIITEKALNYFDSVFTKLNSAINDMNYITLNYDDRQGDKGRNPAWGNPRDPREMIPYCLGVRNGRVALRAFHTSPMHTKRGPENWKFMYVDNMKNVRVSTRRHFSMNDIPSNANPDGDKDMDTVINYVGMNQADREEMARLYNEKGEFVSPLQRVKKNPQNEPGAIVKPNTKNVNSLANLNYTPKENEPNYKNIQRNVQATDSETARQRRFADWDKAEAERQQQTAQQNRQNSPGPVNTRQQQPQRPNVNNNEEEDIENYLNNPNNNYSKYKDI